MAHTTGYAAMPLSRLRSLITTGYGAISKDIEEDAPHHWGDMFARATEVRVREGMSSQDMRAVVAVAERGLRHLCQREYPDLAERLWAIARCHAVIEVTRDIMFDAFVAAQEVVLREQLDIVERLSAPIIPIYLGVLLVPLIGPVDARRAERIMENLLTAISKEQGEAVLLDITGVPEIDAGVAGFLAKAAQAARLLGARVAIVGISPTIAQTMVSGAVDLGGAITLANLQAGLEYALSQRGLVIQSKGALAAR